MEQKQITATYAEAVKAIKEAILESRYRAARLVNKIHGDGSPDHFLKSNTLI